ncbi:MAG: hypothetical protein ACO1QS_09155 [Verrucomicrobiota bacterium]
MKRILPYLLALVLGAILTNAYYAHRLSMANVATVSELESKYNSLHQRLSRIEEKTRQVTPFQVWGFVSTTDQPVADEWPFEHYRTNAIGGYLIDSGFKGGPAIRPEIRLPVGTTNIHEFDVRLVDRMQGDVVIGGWMRTARPDDDLSGFERFYVYRPAGTNVLRLVMQLKPGRSVKMRFDLTVMREHNLKN